MPCPSPRKVARATSTIVIVAALLVACSSPAAAPPAGPGPNAPSTPSSTTASPALADYGALKTKLGQLTKAMSLPSAVVVVRSPTYGDATFSFGTLELGRDATPTPTDHYRIGSNTKPMTATIILQLVQEGKLALDDPVSKFRPEVPNGDKITIGQLLDMRSGLQSYDEFSWFRRELDKNPERVWQPDEVLALAFKEPPLSPPGTAYHYSNTNYVLLGLIMEQVTRRSAEDLFRERLFAPLGMQNTFLPKLTDASIPRPFAHGYMFGTAEASGAKTPALPSDQQRAAANGTLRPNDWTKHNISWGWTSGSVVTTADDLTVFVDAMVEGGLLDADMQRQRFASVQPTGLPLEYGYGLMKVNTYYGHNGQIPGYQSYMLHDPDTHTSIVVLTTLTSAPDGRPPADVLAEAVVKGLG